MEERHWKCYSLLQSRHFSPLCLFFHIIIVVRQLRTTPPTSVSQARHYAKQPDTNALRHSRTPSISFLFVLSKAVVSHNICVCVFFSALEAHLCLPCINLRDPALRSFVVPALHDKLINYQRALQLTDPSGAGHQTRQCRSVTLSCLVLLSP